MNQYDEAGKVPHFHFVASQPDPTPQDVAAPTLEQLAKDAARYRWLRDSHCMEDLPQVYADDDCNTWLTGEELDVAIDAAMSIATPPCK